MKKLWRKNSEIDTGVSFLHTLLFCKNQLKTYFHRTVAFEKKSMKSI